MATNIVHLMKGLYPDAQVEGVDESTAKVAIGGGGDFHTIKMAQVGGKTTLTATKDGANGSGTRTLTKAEVTAAVKKGAAA